jgi:valyl-tRNA synthetase
MGLVYLQTAYICNSIPVWYCKECGEVMVAKEEWMPIDPTQDSPKIHAANAAALISSQRKMYWTHGWIHP